ncbi:hypothetical protein NOCA2390003 [metagenome]|uniref:Uncharacterized protein n=1 Tax=metagenome TaxID=256318 RepID=A0A2P2C4U6_9ZZZZ
MAGRRGPPDRLEPARRVGAAGRPRSPGGRTRRGACRSRCPHQPHPGVHGDGAQRHVPAGRAGGSPRLHRSRRARRRVGHGCRRLASGCGRLLRPARRPRDRSRCAGAGDAGHREGPGHVGGAADHRGSGRRPRLADLRYGGPRRLRRDRRVGPPDRGVRTPLKSVTFCMFMQRSNLQNHEWPISDNSAENNAHLYSGGQHDTGDPPLTPTMRSLSNNSIDLRRGPNSPPPHVRSQCHPPRPRLSHEGSGSPSAALD